MEEPAIVSDNSIEEKVTNIVPAPNHSSIKKAEPVYYNNSSTDSDRVTERTPEEIAESASQS